MVIRQHVASTGLASQAPVLVLPHWGRPIDLASLLAVFALLEVSYQLLVGDVSCLDTAPSVHLEPQARQAVLRLMFHQRELDGPGAARWVVPVWRVFNPFPAKHRSADTVDLALRIGSPSCLRGPPPAGNRLKWILQEAARKVWIARHWDEGRMVDAWASCVADRLRACGERIPSTASVFDAVHLWAHDTGFGPCRERRVSRRLNAAVEALWLEAPDLERELLEGTQFCPAPHAGERPR